LGEQEITEIDCVSDKRRVQAMGRVSSYKREEKKIRKNKEGSGMGKRQNQ